MLRLVAISSIKPWFHAKIKLF